MPKSIKFKKKTYYFLNSNKDDNFPASPFGVIAGVDFSNAPSVFIKHVYLKNDDIRCDLKSMFFDGDIEKPFLLLDQEVQSNSFEKGNWL